MNEKWVVKNEEDKLYFSPDLFPPVQKDIWKAKIYDTPEEARGSLSNLMREKWNPSKFKVVKITLTEEVK